MRDRRLLLAAKAADHLDGDGKSGKPIPERLRVLEREHRGRGEKRDLLAVHDGLERGTDRHFGLAVADVAAQQAVHRRGRLHVFLDVCGRRRLVGRQLIWEGLLELLLPVCIGTKGVTLEPLCAARRASEAPPPCRASPS